MAGCEIHSVYAGIAGSHIRSLNSHGIVAIKDKEVDAGRRRARDRRGAGGGDPGRPEDPAHPAAGIHHRRPGGHPRADRHVAACAWRRKVHIVTGAVSAAQNIVKCVQRCGLEVDDIVLEQLASSYAVLTEDEKELGVCLVDIGGGTTDIAVFSDGAIRHTAVIPIAGDQVTNDIAVALRTPTQYAEEIKIKLRLRAVAARATPTRPSRCRASATARRAASRARRWPRSSSRATRSCSRWCSDELRRSGFEDLIAARHRAHRRQRQDGRRRSSSPRRSSTCRCASACRSTCSGLVDVVRNPIHSTGVGLLLYGARAPRRSRARPRGAGRRRAKACWTRMKSWFQGNF